MIGVCLAAAGLVAGLGTAPSASLPLQAFTLAWTHSIEKIRWEEDYRVVPSADGLRLQLTEARIRGSGAGMEPPPDAVFAAGAWHYVPPLPPLERLHLARSDYVADYQLCWDGSCRSMAALVGPPAAVPAVDVFACSLR